MLPGRAPGPGRGSLLQESFLPFGQPVKKIGQKFGPRSALSTEHKRCQQLALRSQDDQEYLSPVLRILEDGKVRRCGFASLSAETPDTAPRNRIDRIL
jgi:hypothetical protein